MQRGLPSCRGQGGRSCGAAAGPRAPDPRGWGCQPRHWASHFSTSLDSVSTPPPHPTPRRLTNSLMMHGRNNGKKLMAVKIVKHTFGEGGS